ncbi:MAG: preprotein translocase subunit SecA [Pirellulaceae bacterium]
MSTERERQMEMVEAENAPADLARDLRLSTNPVSRLLSSSQGLAGMRLEHWKGLLPLVEKHEEQYQGLNQRELKKASLALRFRARSGESLSKILPEAYALCRVVSAQVLGMRHYDVQILGGIALFKGAIAEMETGEGKTLTATLPVYLRSLMGRGVHVATVNDYLAERDAALLKPVYKALGLTVGTVLTEDSRDQRREAYHADITYGTAKEFGFDFMRDRLLLRRMGHEADSFLGAGSSQRWDESGDRPVQREAYFALLDEADSILIDDARTPLIIGSLEDEAREQIVQTYQWAAEMAPQFNEEDHYDYDHEKRKVELNFRGRQFVRSVLKPDLVMEVGLVDLYEYIERAVKVGREFFLDEQFVIREGEIVIVDESTGRIAEGRKWRDGIHQAVEAKEGVEVSVPTGQAARITVQDFFLRYRHLAGMTGTARTSAKEFRKVYKLSVVKVPTNRPNQRAGWNDKVFGTEDAKWDAIVGEVIEIHGQGRPILIGTRSIDKSNILSAKLHDAGIAHHVLNANEVEREAEIVELAGLAGRVTVATNMAGRGTDIKLGSGVPEKGGLHVICTELHDSARIDRQLIGRCARQGDPGSYRQFISLGDKMLEEAHGDQKAEKYKALGAGVDGEVNQYVGLIRRAQHKVEKKHFRDRSVMLHYEKERRRMQREIGQDPYLDSAE